MPHGHVHLLRINLTRLQTEALQLQYPPLLLEMATQVYTGTNAIVAEQEMTPFFKVQNGVPAGCPQAPLLAKAVLAPALQPWQAAHPAIYLGSGKPRTCPKVQNSPTPRHGKAPWTPHRWAAGHHL